MTLLSGLLKYPWKRPAPNVVAPAEDQRGAERFDVRHPVSVGRYGDLAVAGTVINLSISGAAIRIEEADAAWLARLDQGDDLWLAGLLEHPMSCWVVVVDDHVLRVHFARDAALRHQIREVTGRLLASSD